jgi:hypothetical protein
MRRYRLTPHDRERQRMMFADPQLREPEPLPLVVGDPQPVALRGGSGPGGGWTAFLYAGGVPIWHCAHRHRSEAGALTCAWRQRGVELERRRGRR